MSVGYDMYCRLLRAAVAQSKGKPPEEEPGEVEVDLGLSAFLPTDYIPDEPVRMSVLRRLATAGKKKAQGIEAELTDRFGPLPAPARELLDLFQLRRYVRLAGISSLAADGLGGMLIQLADKDAFEQRHPFRPEQLYLITPERLRVPWPDDVTTPSSRLRYLLETFQARSPAGSRR
jgi:transcription-repair coupling factor (superfamily II helicase)